MAIQIANPAVVAKICRLAAATGLSKTAAVDRAVDKLLVETRPAQRRDVRDIQALLERFDQIPDRSDRFDPLDWDDTSLPR